MLNLTNEGIIWAESYPIEREYYNRTIAVGLDSVH